MTAARAERRRTAKMAVFPDGKILDQSLSTTLSLPERVFLMITLPPTGSVVGLRARRELMEALSPSDEEAERSSYEDRGNGQFAWDNRTAPSIVKNFTFSKEQTDIIRKALKDASDQERLHESLLRLAEKLGLG